MGIGYRIKEAREHLGLTQSELGQLVGVTGPAITNYEKETSHPKEPVMYKLFEALQVDANYLFQDVSGAPRPAGAVSPDELELIRKYRVLDGHGREMVDFTLLKEWERTRENTEPAKILPIHEDLPPHLLSNAAHLRTDIEIPKDIDTSENEIMDDENF